MIHFLGGFVVGYNVWDKPFIYIPPFIVFYYTRSLGWAFASWCLMLFLAGFFASLIAERVFTSARRR